MADDIYNDDEDFGTFEYPPELQLRDDDRRIALKGVVSAVCFLLGSVIVAWGLFGAARW